MKKVAFLVLAHTNPSQVEVLARTLSTFENDRVFVHYDKKSDDDLSVIKSAILTPDRIRTYHGGFSLVSATLSLIEAARSNNNFDYYLLLSGQCFPVQNREWLESQLAQECDFINFVRMPKPEWAKNLDRLEFRHIEHFTGARRIAWKLFARLLPRQDFVKGMGMWPYAGSQWWCLRSSTVDFILRYVNTHKSYSEFLSKTSHVDEVFFQSIISQMKIESELRPALFFAEFDKRTRHPVVLSEADIVRLENEEVFIARKFDLDMFPNPILYFSKKYSEDPGGSAASQAHDTS